MPFLILFVRVDNLNENRFLCEYTTEPNKCCLLLFNTGVSNPENVEHLEEQNMFNM